LRAAAVIPVVLFHAGLSRFSGGFLGVDVFFVISGYLITSILLGEAERGTFSIVAFYNRRARRIFPALFVLLAVTSMVALLLLTPAALERYGRSLIATTLFSSNILFFQEAGYFDASSHEKPLLHTWSLAVEEQFYLVWPLVLATFFRFGKRQYLFPFLVAGVIGSFALSALVPLLTTADSFYLPFTRAWELGLGALLAVRSPRIANASVREAAAAAGLVAILVAVLAFDQDTPLALASGVACAGTALLIVSNSERTVAGRLLSIPLLVGIGLISYSLYLWHWPLLAFAHYYYSAPPGLALGLGILLVATILAYLSYVLVERPLRRPGPPKKAFILSGTVMAILVAIGIAMVVSKGFPQRFAPEIARAEADRREEPCLGCTFGTGDEPQIVLWGDSHGMAIAPAVRSFTADHGLAGIAFTATGCPPLVGAQPHKSSNFDPDKCRVMQEQTIARIAELKNVKLIILGSRWTMASETYRFADEEGTRYFLQDARSRTRSMADSRRALRDGLHRTVSTLMAIQPKARILVIGQSPELGFDATDCLIRGMVHGRSTTECERVPPAALDRLAFSNALLSELARTYPRVSTMFLSRMLCDQRSCPTRVGRTFIYSDDDHVSADGARLLLSDCLAKAIGDRGRPPARRQDHLTCKAEAFID